MSWKFPKHPFHDGGAINQGDANDNFREIAEELTGQLGEHNWSENTITDRNHFNGDAVFVWSGSKKDTSASGRLSAGYSASYATAVAAGAQVVPTHSSWTPIDDTTLTISCPSCLLWIHGTAQTHAYNAHLESSWTSGLGNLSDFTPITRMAIQIDGSVLPETITGGVLANQERMGINCIYYPLGTSVLIPASAGTHEISLVIASTSPGDDGLDFFIENREIVCLQMRK